MKVSAAVSFLTGVMEQEGDIKIQSITGFWVHHPPSPDEPVVILAVGDGKSVEDVLHG